MSCDKLLLRITEAAQLVGCSRSTAYELSRRGEWPIVVTPYGRRVPLDGLKLWVERQPKEGGR